MKTKRRGWALLTFIFLACGNRGETGSVAEAPEMAAEEQKPSEGTETEAYIEPPIPVNEMNDPVTGIEYFEKIQWIGMYDHPDIEYAQVLKFRFNCPPIDSFMKMCWQGVVGKGVFWMERRIGSDYFGANFEKLVIDSIVTFKERLRDEKRISDGMSFDENNPATMFGEFHWGGSNTNKPDYYLKWGGGRTGVYHQVRLGDYWPGDNYQNLYEDGHHFITYSAKEKAFIPEKAFGQIYWDGKLLANDDFKIVVKSTAPLKELMVLKAPQYSIPFIPYECIGGDMWISSRKKVLIVKRDLSSEEEELSLDENLHTVAGSQYSGWVERDGQYGVWIKVLIREKDNTSWWVWSRDFSFSELETKEGWKEGPNYRYAVYLHDILRYSYEKEEGGSIVFEATPEKDYIIADINDDRVRVRSEHGLDSETLGYVNKGDEVKIYERGKEKQQVESMNAYWYRVKTAEDQEGWVYGAFLE
jgi:hypothetical protein